RCALGPLPPVLRAARNGRPRTRGPAGGVLVIPAHRHRPQAQTRNEARDRLIELTRRAAAPPTPRGPTRPPVRARRERLETKKRHSGLKRLRAKRPSAED